MMLRALTLTLTATGAVVFLAGAGPAVAGTQAPAAPYALTVIADSADGFDPVEFGCAALNADGEVAFRARTDGGVEAILRGNGGALTTITDDSANAYDFLGRNPSINDAGEVSFAASLRGPGESVFRGDGETLDAVATTVDQPYQFFGFDTSINNKGRVAFKAELDGNDQGLFSARVLGRDKTYYLTSESEFLGDQTGPSIRKQRVAFSETRDDFSTGIFVVDRNGAVTTIADDSGPLGLVENPSLGGHGEVALHAYLDAGGEAIMSGDGGDLVTVADTDGPYGSFGFETPSRNRQGDVVFSAALDGSFDTGVYAGPDPAADAILVPGDEVAGSTVLNVNACSEALNESGSVAVQAQLVDGRTVIVRADPTID